MSEAEPVRLLPLKGGRNFRDLGGYDAADGRKVRWRQLFRSGNMSRLKEDDYRYLADFGIKVVVDLRSNIERTAEPTVWRGQAPRMYVREYDLDMRQLGPGLIGATDPAATRQAIIEHYKDIPYDQAEAYRALFAELADDALPLAFHCSAGKDRAGTAAALVLIALGTPRDQVMHDYSLSETFVDYEREMGGAHVGAGASNILGIIQSMSKAARASFLRSDPDYLHSALTEIERREGSVENFIRRQLHVSDAQIEKIRDRLLEP